MAERRASARLPCDRAVFVHFRDAWGEHWRSGVLRDVSPGGFGVVLRQALSVGIDLTLEPPTPGAGRPLVGRVVHVTPLGKYWLHGGSWADPVSDADLQALYA
jgi:hypothetical protein